MCQFNWIKITHRDSVMNLNCLPVAAPFTNTICPFHGLFSCVLPTNPIATRGTPLPTGMCILYDKFRLPFSHTPIVTKNLIGVKVAGRSCHGFTAPVTRFCYEIRAPGIFSSVFTLLCAFPRAIDLVSLASACGWFPAHGTQINTSITPTVLKVTIGRAKDLTRTAIIGVKWFSAMFTYSGFGKFFHGYIINTIAKMSIEIEEKYCEIAVQRLAQEVLPL